MKLPQIFLFLFFIVLLASPMVVATDKFTTSFNSELNLKRTCFNNGTWCSSSAECNITIQYPDSSILKDNVLMTNQNSYHNITILKSEVNQLGFYEALMVCTDPSNDLSGADSFQLEVTGDGFPQDVFPTELSLIIFGIFLIIVGSFNDNLKFMQLMGSMLTFIMGVRTLYPGWANFNYTTLPGQALAFILIAIGFIYLIRDSFSQKKQSERYDINHTEDGRVHD